MTSCLLENGCLDSWTWTDDPIDCPVTKNIDAVCLRAAFTPMGLRPRTLRGTKGLNSDAHYWEIKLDVITVLSLIEYVGVVGRTKPMTPGKELVSRDSQERDQKQQRWGLSLSKCDLFPKHDSCVQGTYSQPFHHQSVIGVLLERKKGTLSYYQDGVPLGVAFTVPNYLDYELYPAVWNFTFRTGMHLGKQLRSLNNLQERCRATIMEEISEKIHIDLLNLPTAMKDYLRDGWCDKQKSESMISANKTKKGSIIRRAMHDGYKYVRSRFMSFTSSS